MEAADLPLPIEYILNCGPYLQAVSSIHKIKTKIYGPVIGEPFLVPGLWVYRDLSPSSSPPYIATTWWTVQQLL